MRDFPIFTTENGVGSLVLKEIPYRGVAYITIRDSSAPAEFLNECADFCRAVGAQHVYASGHSILESYPVYTSIVQMSASTEFIPETDAALFPVTEKTAVPYFPLQGRSWEATFPGSGRKLAPTASSLLVRHPDTPLPYRF